MFTSLVLPLTVLALQQAPVAQTAAVPVRIDVNHSTLGFSVRHFGITRIRGNFNEWSGTILWNESDITKSSVAVIARTASVDTRNRRRDEDLVSEDFFASERFPAIVFMSKRIEKAGEGYLLTADVTVRGITREVTVPFQFLGAQDVRGRRIFAAGSFTIKRSEFDLARENRLARALGAVSDEVELELEIQGAVSDPAAQQFDSRRAPSIGDELAGVIERESVRAGLARYEALRSGSADAYNFSDREMLVLAYRLRAAGNADGARQVAEFMSERSPGLDWLVLRATVAHDGGQRDQARSLLDQALSLDPFDTTALAFQQLLAGR